MDKSLLSKPELTEWSNRHDTLFLKKNPVAVFTHYEVELYKGSVTKEICLEALTIDTSDVEAGIIKYAHTLHPNDKVQFKPKYKF